MTRKHDLGDTHDLHDKKMGVSKRDRFTNGFLSSFRTLLTDAIFDILTFGIEN